MDDPFVKRVRAAAVAGWLTLPVVWGATALAWFCSLHMLAAKPVWMLRLMGSGVTWETVQSATVWIFAAFKLCIWVLVTLLVWLSFWARRLRRTAG